MEYTQDMKKGSDYIGIGVGAMIFDDQGRLLLTKRGQGAKNERGFWEIPGGGVEFNETRADAAVREVKEELGVDIEVVDELQTIDHLIPADGQHWVTTSFIGRVKDDQTPRIMEPNKCDAIEWFALDQLPSPLSIATKINLEFYKGRTDHVTS